MSALRTLWQAMMSPSRPDETPYESAVIVLAHAVIGAAAASLVAELAVTAASSAAWPPRTTVISDIVAISPTGDKIPTPTFELPLDQLVTHD